MEMCDSAGIINRKIKMRGASRKEIAEYFRGLSKYADHDKRFYGTDWMVELGDENPCVLCSIILMEIDITFSASQECMEALLADFRLKFMRAGG